MFESANAACSPVSFLSSRTAAEAMFTASFLRHISVSPDRTACLFSDESFCSVEGSFFTQERNNRGNNKAINVFFI